MYAQKVVIRNIEFNYYVSDLENTTTSRYLPKHCLGIKCTMSYPVSGLCSRWPLNFGKEINKQH